MNHKLANAFEKLSNALQMLTNQMELNITAAEITGNGTITSHYNVPLIDYSDESFQDNKWALTTDFYFMNSAANPKIRQLHGNVWIETGNSTFSLNNGTTFLMGFLLAKYGDAKNSKKI